MLLSKTSKIDWLVLLLFAFSAMALEGTMLQIALHVVLPIVFIIIGIQHVNGLLPNISLKYYLALLIWLGLSCFTAYNSDVAFSSMIKIASTFLCSLAAYHLACKRSIVVWLYMIMLLRFVLMMYYARNNIGYTIAYEMQDRLQDEVFNANSFAYSLLYASFACYVLFKKYFKVSFIIEIILIIALMVLSFWISLMTASRQVLLLQLPLLFFLFSIGRSKSKLKSVFLIIILVLIVIGLLPYFESYYYGSLLADRSSGSIMEDARSMILLEALKVGIEHPFLGVGPSNFMLVNSLHIFSHNNFAEIFVSAGLPALILYICLVWRNLKTQWKRYKETSDYLFLYIFCFQVFFIIDNLFYVQIGALWLMAFYFVSVGHSDSYYRDNYKIVKYEN